MEKLNKIAVVPDVHGKLFWQKAKNIFGDIKQIVGHNRLYSPKQLTEGVQCIDTVDSEILYLGE